MMNANYASDARGLSDAELAAVVATYQAEQNRRAAVTVDGADQKIWAMLQAEHANRFGDANPRAVQIAQERHRRLFG